MDEIEADLAWHVRAWGQWVLDRARRELAQYYPTYADFEPLKKDQIAYEHQPMHWCRCGKTGRRVSTRSMLSLRQTTWPTSETRGGSHKPTVAYLWARTVTCKNCRRLIPLLKTRWLCRKDKKRTC